MIYNISKWSLCSDLPPNSCAICMCFDYGKGSVSQKKEANEFVEKLKKIETFLTLNFLAISYTNKSFFFLHKLFKHDDKHIRLKKSVSSSSMKQNSANAHLFKFLFARNFLLDFDRKSPLMSSVKDSIQRMYFFRRY